MTASHEPSEAKVLRERCKDLMRRFLDDWDHMATPPVGDEIRRLIVEYVRVRKRSCGFELVGTLRKY